MDGNAKLHRRTCGTPCAEENNCGASDLHLVRGCSESPQQRGVFCTRHQKLASTPTLVAQIEAHRVRPPLSASSFLEVDVRPTGYHRWQPASTIDSDTVQAYFANCGEQVVQDRRRKKQERRDLARNPAKFVLDDWSSQASKRKCTKRKTHPWLPCAQPADLLACSAVSESGNIGALHEVITAETLSQRYCFLAQVAIDMPELQTLVHDDACHVRVFSLCQTTGAPTGSLAERLSRLRFVIDRPNVSYTYLRIRQCAAVSFGTHLLGRKRAQKRLRGAPGVASLQQPAHASTVVRRKLLPLWPARMEAF